MQDLGNAPLGIAFYTKYRSLCNDAGEKVTYLPFIRTNIITHRKTVF